jgi:hypothetical protein
VLRHRPLQGRAMAARTAYAAIDRSRLRSACMLGLLLAR